MNRLLFMILLCSSFFAAQAQQGDSLFVKHLFKNGLFSEAEQYSLQNMKNDSTFAFHYLARSYYNSNKDSALVHLLQLHPKTFESDTSLLSQLNLRFLLPLHPMHQKWFTEVAPLYSTHLHSPSIQLYALGENPFQYPQLSWPEPVQKELLHYQKMYRKKKWVAGGLSILIPGAGKLYIGRKNMALNTFFSHVIMGINLYESIHQVGWSKPLTYLNLGFLGSMYLSNIVGTLRDFKTRKKELKTQFLYRAYQAYHPYSNAILY